MKVKHKIKTFDAPNAKAIKVYQSQDNVQSGTINVESEDEMALNYENTHCRMAAKMLGTTADLLDYRLIEYLNSIAELVLYGEDELIGSEAIAVAIVAWQTDQGDDFTKPKS